MEKKKVYTPPTMTDHGKVTIKTQGMVGTAWEAWGKRTIVSDPKDPDAE